MEIGKICEIKGIRYEIVGIGCEIMVWFSLYFMGCFVMEF